MHRQSPKSNKNYLSDIIKQTTDHSVRLMNLTSNSQQMKPSYIYTVHPSYNSETAISIVRTLNPAQEMIPTRQENPYIFKPKSYSSKRLTPSSLPHEIYQISSRKKTKKEESEQTLPQLLFSNVIDEIQSQLISNDENYFRDSFFNEKKVNLNTKLQLPIQNDTQIDFHKNHMLCSQIQIISNSNEKIAVDIHQGLLKANINHKNSKNNDPEIIINPFAAHLRNKYLQEIPFQKNYKSGYAPIQMQLKNAEDTDQMQNHINSKSKNHFIRKQQSTLSLSRTCGVSYVKPSESQQSKPYQPLPPLIFQCSSSFNHDQQFIKKYKKIVHSFLNFNQTKWLPFIITQQSQMRSLLLGKRKGRVGWVFGIQNLWPLFTEGTVIIILYGQNPLFHEEQVWNALLTCHFKIGILSKRSTSGKKSFLKSILPKNCNSIKDDFIDDSSQIENSYKLFTQQDNKKISDQNTSKTTLSAKNNQINFLQQLQNFKNIITLSLRLEMYVNEVDWKNYQSQHKQFLNLLIINLKQHLESNCLKIINKRINLSKQKEKGKVILQQLHNIRLSKNLNFSIISQFPMEIQQQKPFNIILKMIKTWQQKKSDYQDSLELNSDEITFLELQKLVGTDISWQKSLKMPLYYISTRDSFAFDLIQKTTTFQRNGHFYNRIDYYFFPENVPNNYTNQYRKLFSNLEVGITCYHNFFTEAQLNMFEQETFNTEKKAFRNKFLQMTVQPSIIGSKIKRTKFFFGYRYIWTACQIAEPGSYVGAGVRKDVTPAPQWTKNIEIPLVNQHIVGKNFINSIAINVYHDGKQGLAQHFDDAVRFKQPIYTLRLFSDARLSFGSQFYGFCNGAFIIPLPRGCICVMQQNSYAANGVKHCVRPCDMTGKSAAVILRQMHHQVVNQASKFDELIDLPCWFSTLSEEPNALTYAEQKRKQAQNFIKIQKI